MRAAVPVLLVALPLAAVPALAVNPLDDDAGTGGDAGDLLTFATPLRPGRYDGTLTPPIDLQDVYVFEARRGQVLELAVDGAFVDVGLYSPLLPLYPDSYYFLFPPDEGRFLLPADGPWYLLFLPASNWLQPPMQRYTFAFSVGSPATAIMATSENGWQTMEVRWSEPTDLVVYGRLALGPDAGSSPSTMVGFELYSPDGVLVDYAFHHFTWGGVGDEVEVAPVASVPLEPPALFAEGTGGSASVLWRPRAEAGSMRLSIYQTTSGTSLLTFLADVPAEHATAAGDGVHRRSIEEFEGGLEVHTPLADLSDGDEWSVNLHDHVLGFFDTWGGSGWVEDPHGRRTAVGPTTAERFFAGVATPVLFLIGAEPGRWTFHVDGDVLATFSTPWSPGPWVDALYFDAASLPRLGLAG